MEIGRLFSCFITLVGLSAAPPCGTYMHFLLLNSGKNDKDKERLYLIYKHYFIFQAVNFSFLLLYMLVQPKINSYGMGNQSTDIKFRTELK